MAIKPTAKNYLIDPDTGDPWEFGGAEPSAQSDVAAQDTARSVYMPEDESGRFPIAKNHQGVIERSVRVAPASDTGGMSLPSYTPEGSKEEAEELLKATKQAALYGMINDPDEFVKHKDEIYKNIREKEKALGKHESDRPWYSIPVDIAEGLKAAGEGLASSVHRGAFGEGADIKNKSEFSPVASARFNVSDEYIRNALIGKDEKAKAFAEQAEARKSALNDLKKDESLRPYLTDLRLAALYSRSAKQGRSGAPADEDREFIDKAFPDIKGDRIIAPPGEYDKSAQRERESMEFVNALVRKRLSDPNAELSPAAQKVLDSLVKGAYSKERRVIGERDVLRRYADEMGLRGGSTSGISGILGQLQDATPEFAGGIPYEAKSLREEQASRIRGLTREGQAYEEAQAGSGILDPLAFALGEAGGIAGKQALGAAWKALATSGGKGIGAADALGNLAKAAESRSIRFKTSSVKPGEGALLRLGSFAGEHGLQNLASDVLRPAEAIARGQAPSTLAVKLAPAAAELAGEGATFGGLALASTGDVEKAKEAFVAPAVSRVAFKAGTRPLRLAARAFDVAGDIIRPTGAKTFKLAEPPTVAPAEFAPYLRESAKNYADLSRQASTELFNAQSIIEAAGNKLGEPIKVLLVSGPSKETLFASQGANPKAGGAHFADLNFGERLDDLGRPVAGESVRGRTVVLDPKSSRFRQNLAHETIEVTVSALEKSPEGAEFIKQISDKISKRPDIIESIKRASPDPSLSDAGAIREAVIDNLAAGLLNENFNTGREASVRGTIGGGLKRVSEVISPMETSTAISAYGAPVFKSAYRNFSDLVNKGLIKTTAKPDVAVTPSRAMFKATPEMITDQAASWAEAVRKGSAPTSRQYWVLKALENNIPTKDVAKWVKESAPQDPLFKSKKTAEGEGPVKRVPGLMELAPSDPALVESALRELRGENIQTSAERLSPAEARLRTTRELRTGTALTMPEPYLQKNPEFMSWFEKNAAVGERASMKRFLEKVASDARSGKAPEPIPAEFGPGTPHEAEMANRYSKAVGKVESSGIKAVDEAFVQSYEKALREGAEAPKLPSEIDPNSPRGIELSNRIERIKESVEGKQRKTAKDVAKDAAEALKQTRDKIYADLQEVWDRQAEKGEALASIPEELYGDPKVMKDAIATQRRVAKIREASLIEQFQARHDALEDLVRRYEDGRISDFPVELFNEINDPVWPAKAVSKFRKSVNSLRRDFENAQDKRNEAIVSEAEKRAAKDRQQEVRRRQEEANSVRTETDAAEGILDKLKIEELNKRLSPEDLAALDKIIAEAEAKKDWSPEARQKFINNINDKRQALVSFREKRALAEAREQARIESESPEAAKREPKLEDPFDPEKFAEVEGDGSVITPEVPKDLSPYQGLVTAQKQANNAPLVVKLRRQTTGVSGPERVIVSNKLNEVRRAVENAGIDISKLTDKDVVNHAKAFNIRNDITSTFPDGFLTEGVETAIFWGVDPKTGNAYFTPTKLAFERVNSLLENSPIGKSKFFDSLKKWSKSSSTSDEAIFNDAFITKAKEVASKNPDAARNMEQLIKSVQGNLEQARKVRLAEAGKTSRIHTELPEDVSRILSESFNTFTGTRGAQRVHTMVRPADILEVNVVDKLSPELSRGGIAVSYAGLPQPGRTTSTFAPRVLRLQKAEDE